MNGECFNPRPAGWPGAADDLKVMRDVVDVSILARLVGRALRIKARGLDSEWLFQSSPGWLAGRCVPQHWTGLWSAEFQSSPGWLAGRCD